MEITKMATGLGAVATGITSVKNLVDHQSIDLDILPSARSALVIACGHSRAGPGWIKNLTSP